MIRVWQKLHLNSYFSLKNEIKLASNLKLDSPLVLLPNGNLAAASFNKILVWDIVKANGTLIQELSGGGGGHNDFIRALVAWRSSSSNEKRLTEYSMASGSDDII